MKTKKALCYGDYSGKSDKWLDKRADKIHKELERILMSDDYGMVLELCEIERELTLREEDPY